jgi:hypothetical protein
MSGNAGKWNPATKVIRKRIHAVATVWFVACVGYLVAVGLRRAGFNWWLILSLSGYSTSMLLLLICLYLCVFVHGIRGARRSEAEHPLTGTACYMFLYVSIPLLAGLRAAAGTNDAPGTSASLICIATVTLKATFIAWIVVDPLVGLLEMDLPASRSHRAERLARTKQYDHLTGRTGPRD